MPALDYLNAIARLRLLREQQAEAIGRLARLETNPAAACLDLCRECGCPFPDGTSVLLILAGDTADHAAMRHLIAQHADKLRYSRTSQHRAVYAILAVIVNDLDAVMGPAGFLASLDPHLTT